MALRDWAQLVMVAGIDARRLSSMDVFLLSSKLLNDSVLTAKTRELYPGPILPRGARVEAIKQMSAQERQALRERVTGVIPLPAKKTA